ncbi:ADP-ribosylglycohydrolase family protein [Rhizocola hellebori]|nr:ADP-ribosylglycohydrolase family protein [Rhizocola hellebori]
MRATGSMFGLAYGDALGKPVEFKKYPAIVAAFGPGGPTELHKKAQVTDDTQMALAVGWALLSEGDLVQNLTTHFVKWLKSPDNNRAPGNTCMRACLKLDYGLPWEQASIRGSKGCGANMRVTPVGLVKTYDDDTTAYVAQLQAAMTHGHPTALAASELTAFAVRFLVQGATLHELPGLLLERCRSQRQVMRVDGFSSPAGWDECREVLENLQAVLSTKDDGGDVCARTGEGWIAEEALATALHAALRHPDDSVAALGRACATNGDSDSIACLAGAFHGAAYGMTVWPAEWSKRIEYRDQLAKLGAAWD